MRNDGSLLEELAQKEENKIIDGMGIKYVKARLEERYPGKWQLKYGLNNNFWEVTIQIFKQDGR